MYPSDHGISVKVLSKSEYRIAPRVLSRQLTTFELEYPRYIHGQMMTHRVFSRNAQSSRAISIERNILTIEKSNWYPVFVANKKGMSADKVLEGDELLEAKYKWDCAKRGAVVHAKVLNEMGLHKQIVNRVLEPFSLIKVVLSGTEWGNFFKLRTPGYGKVTEDFASWNDFFELIKGHGAQQEIQILAESMRRSQEYSETTEITSEFPWHLPYVSQDEKGYIDIDTLKAISVARCARVSYGNSHAPFSIENHVELHDRLLKDQHMSPFEHVATFRYPNSKVGNFRDFTQYRHILEGIA